MGYNVLSNNIIRVMMFALTPEIICLIGFILGPIGRTLYDYGWALMENPDIVFDKRYWITMVGAMVIALFAGLVEAPVFLLALPPEIAEWGRPLLFLFGFAQGFMISHVLNRPLDHARHRETARKTQGE